MEINFGPNSEDEPQLLYKLQRKIKIFDECSLPNRGYNLVACSSKYALVFAASPNGILSVYYLKDLVNKELDNPSHLRIELQEKPTHISVSCDFEYLAVTGGQFLNVYNIVNFQHQNVQPSVSIRCDVDPATYVSSLQWNPCIPDTIALAFFDGTLLVSQVNAGQVKKIKANARCVCWSPKGKQLVVGNSDGSLCQYKPDLTPAKSVPTPDLFQGASVETLAVHWISTYQFAVVYQNSSTQDRPVVAIINTPKSGQPTCLNYDDICYSMGSNRPWYYHLLGIAQWNMILVASSNSMEIATLGSADGSNWTHWCQVDEARPELPLTDKKLESYPVGFCFDYSAIHQLPWGENETLPHMPLLHVVSHLGLLTIFNVINLKTDSQICVPPQNIVLPAAGLITDSPSVMIEVVQQPVPTTVPMPTQTSAPAPVLEPIVEEDKVERSQVVEQPIAASVLNEQPQTGVQPSTMNQLKVQATAQAPTPVQNSSVTPTPEFRAHNLQMDQKKAAEKLIQELKMMLIKEVNDFQMELYMFQKKMQETNLQITEDLKSIEPNRDLQFVDGEKFKKECSIDELYAAVIQLKLELVRSCAVVAEAHSNAGAKDLYMWNQADPLSNRKLESIKKLVYYIESQLDQAHRALDHKWNEILHDSSSKKNVSHMIRPILDDVYQPLVKQQEIIGRQEAVLKTLRNGLNECDLSPMWKSRSLLRSTPFRNKDPLSKLTKNILNMSIDNMAKDTEPKLSAQKLDALKDMLANHKTVKIKPVNVELRQHLATMRLTYEKSLKEKTLLEEQTNVETQNNVKEETEPVIKPIIAQSVKQGPVVKKEAECNPDIIKESVSKVQSLAENVSSTSNLTNVTRKLFSEDIKKETKAPVVVLSKPEFVVTANIPSTTKQPTSTTQSVLKELLQKKTTGLKNDANTFMGQSICSPIPTEKASTNQSPFSTIFSGNQSKPGIFSQGNLSLGQIAPPKNQAVNAQSAETGEAEDFSKNGSVKHLFEFSMPSSNENKTPNPFNAFTEKTKSNKTVFSISGIKPLGTLQTNNQNVPDILNASNVKSSLNQSNKSNVETKPTPLLTPKGKDESVNEQTSFEKATPRNIVDSKPVTQETKPESLVEPLKESTPPLTKLDVAKTEQEPQHTIQSKTSETIPTTMTVTSVSISTSLSETKTESKTSTEVTISEASSLFASANASAPKTPPAFLANVTSQASIFGLAAASQASSIFGTANNNTPSVTSGKTSIFGVSTVASAATSVATTTHPTSVFGTAVTSTTQPLPNTSTPSAVATPPLEIVESKNIPSEQISSIPAITQTSIFGTTTTSTSISSNVFGAPATPVSPVFGSQTASSQPIVFGGPDAQKSIFGSPTTSSQPVFGTPTSSPSSIFGGAVATTQSSIFGAPTITTAASGFGATTTQTSAFGTPSTGTTQPIFGTATPTTTQSPIFGTPISTTTQTPIFGTSTTTTSGASLFGMSESNLFASASISTSSPSQSTQANIFGGGGTTSNVFGGGGGNIFGVKSTFGQNNSAASIFGGQSAFGQQPQQQTNLWGSGTATPTFGSTFGQTNQAQTVFGGGGSFSGGAAPAFGSPAPAATQSPVFGTPQQSSPSFGGSPVFGTKPAFGQGFGGSPTSGGAGAGGFGAFGGFNKSPSSGFGAPAAFGNVSPAKLFGGTSPGFGTASQSNATFESLATQNTLTFGNLAQQSTQQTQPAFSNSPAFTGWRS